MRSKLDELIAMCDFDWIDIYGNSCKLYHHIFVVFRLILVYVTCSSFQKDVCFHYMNFMRGHDLYTKILIMLKESMTDESSDYFLICTGAVSYTHLTLPTICSV